MGFGIRAPSPAWRRPGGATGVRWPELSEYRASGPGQVAVPVQAGVQRRGVGHLLLGDVRGESLAVKREPLVDRMSPASMG